MEDGSSTDVKLCSSGYGDGDRELVRDRNYSTPKAKFTSVLQEGDGDSSGRADKTKSPVDTCFKIGPCSLSSSQSLRLNERTSLDLSDVEFCEYVSVLDPVPAYSRNYRLKRSNRKMYDLDPFCDSPPKSVCQIADMRNQSSYEFYVMRRAVIHRMYNLGLTKEKPSQYTSSPESSEDEESCKSVPMNTPAVTGTRNGNGGPHLLTKYKEYVNNTKHQTKTVKVIDKSLDMRELRHEDVTKASEAVRKALRHLDLRHEPTSKSNKHTPEKTVINPLPALPVYSAIPKKINNLESRRSSLIWRNVKDWTSVRERQIRERLARTSSTGLNRFRGRFSDTSVNLNPMPPLRRLGRASRTGLTRLRERLSDIRVNMNAMPCLRRTWRNLRNSQPTTAAKYDSSEICTIYLPVNINSNAKPVGKWSPSPSFSLSGFSDLSISTSPFQSGESLHSLHLSSSLSVSSLSISTCRSSHSPGSAKLLPRDNRYELPRMSVKCKKCKLQLC